MKNVLYYLDTFDLSKLDNDISTYICMEDIASEFGIHGYNDFHDENIRLKSLLHPDLSWTCTDTAVGISFIFLDKEFVGASSQVARKDDVYYHWLNKECFDKVKAYVYSLLTCGGPKEFIDLDESLEPFELKKKAMDKYLKNRK